MLGTEVSILPPCSRTDLLGSDHDLACRGPGNDGEKVVLRCVERIDVLDCGNIPSSRDICVQNLVDGFAFPGKVSLG